MLSTRTMFWEVPSVIESGWHKGEVGIALSDRIGSTREGARMAEAKMVTFHLRNGEQRTYKDVTHLDTSRPHVVRVYNANGLMAQIAKDEVVKTTHQDSA